MQPSDSAGGPSQKQSGSGANITGFNFDLKSPPGKVSWVLANDSENIWTPSAGGKTVPESTKREWEAVFLNVSKRRKKNGTSS